MKKPILYNAEPLKTDVTPILSRGIYDVFVGAVEEDKLPMYVVINRGTGVIEFTSEVTTFINDWLNYVLKTPPEDAPLADVQMELGLN